MKIPEYISKQEVRQICQEMGIRDWSQLTEARITPEEAEIIQQAVGGEAEQISSLEFQKGLEIELEHGTQFPDANVTNNHPLLTGMIVLAHLKEMLDYYQRLEVAELEGDMMKAFQSGNRDKLFNKYRLLLEAKAELTGKEVSALD
jgi:hypothetical protein